LNWPIAAKSFSLGITPASLFFVAFTITMTLIANLLVRLGAMPRRCHHVERAEPGSTCVGNFFGGGAGRSVRLYSATNDGAVT
jgi:hypothetical protein